MEADEEEPLIAVCERTSTPIEFGCMNGECGTCLVILEGGAPEQPISPQEQAVLNVLAAGEPGARLGCQLFAEGEMKVEYRGLTPRPPPPED